jgi:hypothetical protein
MDTEWVTASELGEWAYCRRAWWYARQGAACDTGPRLAAGTAGHTVIAREVARIERQRGFAVYLLAAALVLTLVLVAVLVALR